MGRNQVRYVRILGAIVLLQRRVHPTLQHAVADARQVDRISQGPGLRLLVA